MEYSFLRSVLYPLATRVLREEEDLGIPRPLMRRAKEEINRYRKLVDEVKLDEPSTVLQLVNRLVDENMPEERSIEWERPQDVIEAWGLEERQYPQGILRTIHPRRVDEDQRTKVFEGDSRTLWRVGPHVYLKSAEEDKPQKRTKVYYDPDVGDSDNNNEAIKQLTDAVVRKMIWNGRDTLKLGYSSQTNQNTFAQIYDYDLGETEYIGPLESLIEPIQSMYHHGHRWCVLIQGKPGVGKTTFAKHVAREYLDTFLFVPKEYFKESSTSNWTRMMDVIQPDGLLIDDPD